MRIAIALLFTLGTSALSWSNLRAGDLSPRFHWPDETTNYFFATRVARVESLAVPEPRNLDAGNLIHPRTMNVRADGALVPGSYLGLPLWYGVVGRVLGERAMLFVTPILAALGLLAFASIVRRLWSSIVAVVATILLALHPSVWLFTATAMLPNIPFVALLLMGFAVVFREPHPLQLPLITRGRDPRESPPLAEGGRGGVLCWLVGGALFGLALTIRTHEIVWVVAIIAAVATRALWRPTPTLSPSQREGEKKRGWGAPFALIVGIVIPFIPILILNSQLYGSPFITGYALLQEGGATPTEFASSLLPGWLTALIAPFGWHPMEAFTRFWTYMVVPYPWFIALALVGMGVTCVRRASSPPRPPSQLEGGKENSISPPHVGRGSARGWAIGTIVLTLWLILYYGSWTIADPLVRETNVLTISYVRYWLPIVVMLAPWAAVGLLAIMNRMPRRWRAHAITLVLLGIALTSFAQVVTDPTEGLTRQRQAIAEHRVRARAVIAATEPNAVIISHRMDKVFFPERAVVHVPIDIVSPSLPEGERLVPRSFSGVGDGVLRNLRILVARAPVYWYAPSTVQLSGFTLVPVSGMPFGELLYRIGT